MLGRLFGGRRSEEPAAQRRTEEPARQRAQQPVALSAQQYLAIVSQMAQSRASIVPHVPTTEDKRAPMDHALAVPTSAGLSLGGMALPHGVAAMIFSHLSRSVERGEEASLGVAALVCREWCSAACSLRALLPATAHDISIRLRLAGVTPGTECDGEYELYHHGDPRSPLRVYCHNVLSEKPTEFITLHSAANWSAMPAGGSCSGSAVKTTFEKLRFDPATLTVKTDDYTFATTVGGPLSQRYWNGQRTLVMDQVPYATARDSNGGSTRYISDRCGAAQLDLRGTGLAVGVHQRDFAKPAFTALGCRPWGKIVCHRPSNVDDCVSEMRAYAEIIMFGGGYAGRCSPALDLTLDDNAKGGNYDNEGRSGGWVLPLAMREDGASELEQRPLVGANYRDNAGCTVLFHDSSANVEYCLANTT